MQITKKMVQFDGIAPGRNPALYIVAAPYRYNAEGVRVVGSRTRFKAGSLHDAERAVAKYVGRFADPHLTGVHGVTVEIVCPRRRYDWDVTLHTTPYSVVRACEEETVMEAELVASLAARLAVKGY